jgi:hypothetical protein
VAVSIRRCRRPGEPLKFAVPEQVRQTGCSSHENVSLFFGDAWYVMRGV